MATLISHDSSRSNSKEKWQILACMSTLYVASYFCILCNAPLEDDIMQQFNLTSTEFALFSSISFAFAIVGSLITPLLLKVVDWYTTTTVSCFLVLFGQIIFIIGLLWGIKMPREFLYVMYFGRAWIGMGYGIQNVTIYSTINIWFEGSQWLLFALNVISSTYELSILISRYAMLPLYLSSKILCAPYVLGLILSVIAILACFMVTAITNKFESQSDMASLLDYNFTKITDFNRQMWLIIICIIIGWASVETFGNQFTVPLMEKFSIGEWYVDILMSVQAIYTLTLGQFVAYIIAKYGYISYYLVAGLVLMSVSMTMLYFYDSNHSTVSPIAAVWIIIVIYIAGVEHFIAVSFTCVYMISPLELSAIVNTTTGVGFMGGSTVQAYLFGILADYYGYSASILMCLCLCLFGLILAVIVWVTDFLIEGPLHRSAKYNSYQKIQSQTDADV